MKAKVCKQAKLSEQFYLVALKHKTAELISSIVEFEGKLRFDINKPDGTPVKRLDVSKLNSIGWQASISLERGIKETYKWCLQNSVF